MTIHVQSIRPGKTKWLRISLKRFRPKIHQDWQYHWSHGDRFIHFGMTNLFGVDTFAPVTCFKVTYGNVWPHLSHKRFGPCVCALHAWGSQFSGHPDLHWGLCYYQQQVDKQWHKEGKRMRHKPTGGLVFQCFLFKNIEWIQKASFRDISKKDTYTCTAYDVPQRPLQWRGNFGFLLSTCC